MRCLITTARLSLVLLLVVLNCGVASAADAVSFNRDIRRVLSDKCFACHGPDANTRQAELRLDTFNDATADLGGHAAIKPGAIDQSELIARITSEDADLVMPPPEYDKPVTADEIAIIKRWIADGAAYEDHWSFTPVKRPNVPTTTSHSGNEINAFIARQLAAAELNPGERAEARTLARRVSFDLTGLPLDPQLVEQFEADPSADAYQQLVDSLLASPHYGERMAMYWLDLVRYADTLGFHGDQDRSVSPYRDYVIDAFNQNKPFDQFTIEQLAGDLLPNATLSQKVASTYNRLNRASAEGGVQPKEYLAKYSADRVRTLGSVWLGTTLGCAECHDHKFDPFTARDFYSVAAFFADIKEQGIVGGANHLAILPVPTPAQAAERGRLRAQLDLARNRFNRNGPDLDTARTDWVAAVAQIDELWQALKPDTVTSAHGSELVVADDGSVLARGTNPDKDNYQLSQQTLDRPLANDDGPKTVALRLELLPHDTLPQKGPGRAGNGNLVINSVDLKINGRPVKWTQASSSHDQSGFPAADLVKSNKGWAILPKVGQHLDLFLVGNVDQSKPNDPAAPAVTLEIAQDHGTGHNLGHFQLSLASSDHVDLSTATDRDIVAIAKLPAADRDPEQAAKLDAAFRKATPILADERNEIASIEKQQKDLESSIVTTLVTEATAPRDIRVLPRGNWMDDSGEVVAPTIPAFLPGEFPETESRASRLELAHWLVDPQNPLVSRTFVNRLWMLFFGQGLARNVDDLGSQGEVPSHPELLDWLAAEFIDSGWDVKHLVRLIVLSDAYQRSSSTTEQMRQIDPLNRLYARQSRHRLDAEIVRDNALAVSGLLDRSIGGRSVRPYQPAGYWAQLNFPRRTYQADAGAAQYRRGLYTHWQRTFLHPSLMAFDAPAREECTAQRSRSNTPLQSLVLLNDPTFVEAARVLAQRIIAESEGSFDAKLDWLYRETLARRPRDNERPLLAKLYEQNREAFEAGPSTAESLLTVGMAPVPEGVNRSDLAAWTAVTRAVLNLHETIMRY